MGEHNKKKTVSRVIALSKSRWPSVAGSKKEKLLESTNYINKTSK